MSLAFAVLVLRRRWRAITINAVTMPMIHNRPTAPPTMPPIRAASSRGGFAVAGSPSTCVELMLDEDVKLSDVVDVDEEEAIDIVECM